MIMGPDKTRLSKRHGATSILEYRDQGYLPEAMINYLVRLGWSSGDQEIFSLAELVEQFSLEHVQKSAAVFNPEKLLWVNAHHIRHGAPSRIAALLVPFLEQSGYGWAVKAAPAGWIERLVVMLRERARTLVEMAKAAEPYLAQEPAMEKEAVQKFMTPTIAPILDTLVQRFNDAQDFSKENLESLFKSVLDEAGMKMGQLAQPVRVALTGRAISPGIFEVVDLLGRDATIARLRSGVALARGGHS
jgi:glutamyl-tRNA synthetase